MVQAGTERDIKRATEELMTYNQRLISIIAKRFKGRGCTHEDMMTDGMLGLHHAIQRYDPNKGYRFSTYATNWIRQAIGRGVENRGREIRLPSHVIAKITHIRISRQAYVLKHGESPSMPELLEWIQSRIDEFPKYLRHQLKTLDVQYLSDITSMERVDIKSLDEPNAYGQANAAYGQANTGYGQANAAYALVGSTTSKISDALDGVFPDIDFTTAEITGGQVLINNILCAAFNIRYNYNGTYQYIQAVFFDKKWFFTKQNPNLKLITSIPTNGKINMYGTTGTDLVFLYSDSTSLIDSVIETALMPMTDPIRTKQALKVGIEATIDGAGLLSTTIDSESSSSPPYLLGNYVVWTNNFGAPISWINNSSSVISWLSTSGYVLYKTDAQQWGKYLGMTVTSNSSAMVINGFEYEHELRVRF